MVQIIRGRITKEVDENLPPFELAIESYLLSLGPKFVTYPPFTSWHPIEARTDWTFLVAYRRYVFG
jgi:hypothetical protein